MRPLIIALMAACGSASRAPADGGLSWWTTCGDPTCNTGGGHRDAGLRSCDASEDAGAPCLVAGAACDPGDDCNTHLLCAASDPKQGSCPISRERYKKDIRYLSAAELESYRDQLLALPLATYRYRSAPAGSRLHLGFMIDGHESLVCVEPERDQVDLYGYTSMAVAALKVQAGEIESLRREVRQLRAQLRSEVAGRGSTP